MADPPGAELIVENSREARLFLKYVFRIDFRSVSREGSFESMRPFEDAVFSR